MKKLVNDTINKSFETLGDIALKAKQTEIPVEKSIFGLPKPMPAFGFSPGEQEDIDKIGFEAWMIYQKAKDNYSYSFAASHGCNKYNPVEEYSEYWDGINAIREAAGLDRLTYTSGCPILKGGNN